MTKRGWVRVGDLIDQLRTRRERASDLVEGEWVVVEEEPREPLDLNDLEELIEWDVTVPSRFSAVGVLEWLDGGPEELTVEQPGAVEALLPLLIPGRFVGAELLELGVDFLWEENLLEIPANQPAPRRETLLSPVDLDPMGVLEEVRLEEPPPTLVTTEDSGEPKGSTIKYVG